MPIQVLEMLHQRTIALSMGEKNESGFFSDRGGGDAILRTFFVEIQYQTHIIIKSRVFYKLENMSGGDL